MSSSVLSEPAGAPGLLALFALIVGDSLGVPVPGDTALIVAGGLAADGQVALPAVIAVATTAAILGDTVVFLFGRRFGRQLVLRDGPFADRRRAALVRADTFYARYGLPTVFFGKFVPGVRAVGALAAGTSDMPWRSFAPVNAIACLTWTTGVATIAYLAGPTGALVLAGAALGASGLALAVGGARRRQRRRRTVSVRRRPSGDDQPTSSA